MSQPLQSAVSTRVSIGHDRVPAEPPLLLDLQHRQPLYVCCVRDPVRRTRRVFLWSCARPRGRAHTAPQTFATFGDLRKALIRASVWPSDADPASHTSASHTSEEKKNGTLGSSSTDSTTSSHASLYIRAATLVGAPLTLEAIDALRAWSQSAESCTFTIVYEPVLRMATVRVWLHRLCSMHT